MYTPRRQHAPPSPTPRALTPAHPHPTNVQTQRPLTSAAFPLASLYMASSGSGGARRPRNALSSANPSDVTEDTCITGTTPLHDEELELGDAVVLPAVAVGDERGDAPAVLKKFDVLVSKRVVFSVHGRPQRTEGGGGGTTLTCLHPSLFCLTDPHSHPKYGAGPTYGEKQKDGESGGHGGGGGGGTGRGKKLSTPPPPTKTRKRRTRRCRCCRPSARPRPPRHPPPLPRSSPAGPCTRAAPCRAPAEPPASRPRPRREGTERTKPPRRRHENREGVQRTAPLPAEGAPQVATSPGGGCPRRRTWSSPRRWVAGGGEGESGEVDGGGERPS